MARPSPLLLGALVLCFAAAATAASYSALDNPSWGWSLTFRDEFDGATIDSTKWRNGVGQTFAGNFEVQAYQASLAYLDGQGHLVLKSQPGNCKDDSGVNRTYCSGWIDTRYRFWQQYGRFEVSAKMPKATVCSPHQNLFMNCRLLTHFAGPLGGALDAP